MNVRLVKNGSITPMGENDPGWATLMPLPPPPPPPSRAQAIGPRPSRFRRVALGVAVAYAVMLVMLFAVVLLYAATHDSYRDCGDEAQQDC